MAKSLLTSDQERLLALGNEVTRQLSTGRMDHGALAAILPAAPEKLAPMRPFAEAFADGLPKPPVGTPLRSFPVLTKVSGGLMGLWAVAGDTGVGKTTFALQVGLDYSRHDGHAVVLYDFENGREVIAHHLGQALGSARRARERTGAWYYRESVLSLPHDLGLCKCRPKARGRHGFVRPPTLVVVDSLQKLSTDESAYHVLRKWLGVFERLARAGYVVLLLSEKPRYQYRKATTAGFADVRAEYTAWFGVQLLADREDDMVTSVNVVKNRHRREKGHVVDLHRDPERVWVFNEKTARSDEDE